MKKSEQKRRRSRKKFEIFFFFFCLLPRVKNVKIESLIACLKCAREKKETLSHAQLQFVNFFFLKFNLVGLSRNLTRKWNWSRRRSQACTFFFFEAKRMFLSFFPILLTCDAVWHELTVVLLHQLCSRAAKRSGNLAFFSGTNDDASESGQPLRWKLRMRSHTDGGLAVCGGGRMYSIFSRIFAEFLLLWNYSSVAIFYHFRFEHFFFQSLILTVCSVCCECEKITVNVGLDSMIFSDRSANCSRTWLKP